MAFDGSAVYSIVKELKEKIEDGRLVKIAQTDKQEMILTVKNAGTQYRLLISVNPSLPVIYLTEQNKNAPLQAPAFCMLLRKHLTNGRIISVTQPSMERIIEFNIEHFNEMGDICMKTLTVELMGKYSNIIFRDGNMILDSIKHVSALLSSVREVLPGREYFIPFSGDKLDPLNTDRRKFMDRIFSEGAMPLSKAIYTNITGFSPMLAEEILFRAGVDSDRPAVSTEPDEQEKVYEEFMNVMDLITDSSSRANIIFRDGEPVAFGTFEYQSYADPRYTVEYYDSISSLLYDFYSKKQSYTSMRQKTADLRQTVNTLLNKDRKKYDLQLRQLKDTEKKDKYKLYGELLTAYGYSAENGCRSFRTTDFYTGDEIDIPLDPTISAVENGKNYFKKYAKLKRTADALNEVIVRTREETEYLESILVSLDMAETSSDISEIKKELSDAGFIRSHVNDKGKKQSRDSSRSFPLHYISSDGLHMYVGKNNYQNEYITFKLASGNDWWFHAKDIPGSHVIVKCEGAMLPDRTYEEAASLAAHYSGSGESSKVEVQYTQKKNLKKPPGAKPGFVVFNTYYSMAAGTDISGIREIKQS